MVVLHSLFYMHDEHCNFWNWGRISRIDGVSLNKLLCIPPSLCQPHVYVRDGGRVCGCPRLLVILWRISKVRLRYPDKLHDRSVYDLDFRLMIYSLWSWRYSIRIPRVALTCPTKFNQLLTCRIVSLCVWQGLYIILVYTLSPTAIVKCLSSDCYKLWVQPQRFGSS